LKDSLGVDGPVVSEIDSGRHLKRGPGRTDVDGPGGQCEVDIHDGNPGLIQTALDHDNLISGKHAGG